MLTRGQAGRPSAARWEATTAAIAGFAPAQK
jgi:hypothetical protein